MVRAGKLKLLVRKTPETEQMVPAIVLASAIHGVDQDLRGIAEEFVSHG